MRSALTLILGASLCFAPMSTAQADPAFQAQVRSQCAGEVKALSGMYAARSPGHEDVEVARVLTMLDDRTASDDLAQMQDAVSTPTASSASDQSKIGMALTRCMYGLRIVAKGAKPDPLLQPATIAALEKTCRAELKANVGGEGSPFSSTEDLAIATLQFLKGAPTAKLKEMNALPVGAEGSTTYGPNSLLRCATTHVMATAKN